MVYVSRLPHCIIIIVNLFTLSYFVFVGYKNWLKNDDLQLIKLSILLTARKKKKTFPGIRIDS